MTDNQATEQTATKRLRKLLDERGVEWWDSRYGKQVVFQVGDVKWFADDGCRDGMVELSTILITPEQAIAATLGSGTCHLEETVHQREIATEFGGGYYDETTYDCDECGFENIDYNIRFCGGCGARVVSQEGGSND